MLALPLSGLGMHCGRRSSYPKNNAKYMETFQKVIVRLIDNG